MAVWVICVPQALSSQLNVTSTCKPKDLMDALRIKFRVPLRQPGSLLETRKLSNVLFALKLADAGEDRLNEVEVDKISDRITMAWMS